MRSDGKKERRNKEEQKKKKKNIGKEGRIERIEGRKEGRKEGKKERKNKGKDSEETITIVRQERKRLHEKRTRGLLARCDVNHPEALHLLRQRRSKSAAVEAKPCPHQCQVQTLFTDHKERKFQRDYRLWLAPNLFSCSISLRTHHSLHAEARTQTHAHTNEFLYSWICLFIFPKFTCAHVTSSLCEQCSWIRSNRDRRPKTDGQDTGQRAVKVSFFLALCQTEQRCCQETLLSGQRRALSLTCCH